MGVSRGFLLNNKSINKEEFRRNVINENVKKGKIFSKYFILMCSIFILIEIISWKFNKGYITTYILLTGLSVAYLEYLKSLDNLIRKPLKFVKMVQYINVIYLVLNIFGITILAYFDNGFYAQVFAFLLSITGCSVIFYLDKKEVAVTYVLSITCFIFDTYLIPSLTILFSPLIKYLIVFCFLFWFVSRVLFLNYYKYYKSKVLLRHTNYRLSKEIEKNRLINHKLAGVNKELMDMSMMDELTQIPNRRSLNLFIESFFCNYFNDEKDFSIIMIDIDNFKLYNDTYGHNCGDEVLKKVAKEIDYLARKRLDFFARFGGEEFIYIATRCDKDEIKLLAEKIRTEVINLKIIHELNIPYKIVTISLGISTIKAHDKTDVLKCTELADNGLYICKKNGRNCSKFVL